MARRRVNLLEDNENLENLEPVINQDNEDRPGSNENEQIDNLSIEQADEQQDEPSKDIETETVTLQIGDRVKIKPGVGNDTLGRRIHAGVQNYVYTIRSIRPDGVACIECLTHVFNVELTDLIIL